MVRRETRAHKEPQVCLEPEDLMVYLDHWGRRENQEQVDSLDYLGPQVLQVLLDGTVSLDQGVHLVKQDLPVSLDLVVLQEEMEIQDPKEMTVPLELQDLLVSQVFLVQLDHLGLLDIQVRTLRTKLIRDYVILFY